jgi:integrase
MANRRGHGEGGIRQRADGRYEATVSLGWRNGKRHRKSIYGRTRREVADKLAAALKAQHDGLAFAPETHKVGSYFDDWLEYVKPTVRPSTWHRYEVNVRVHIKPALGHVRLARLSPQHLTRFYSERQASGLAPRTVLQLHRLIHAALKQAVRWDLVARNVAGLVDPPRAPRLDVQTYTAEEVRTLLAAAAGDQFEALYVLAVTTGMRQGELLGLRWRDVNLDTNVLQVRFALQRMPDKTLQLVEPKTNSSRRKVHLSVVAADALRRHKVRQASERLRLGARWEDHDFVFPNHTGRPMCGVSLLHTHYLPMLWRAGLPRRRFHDLRHTAATLLLEANVNTKVVSELLGHTHVSTTMDIYQHVTPTMQHQAAGVFDDLFSDSLAVNLAVNDARP